MPCKPKGETVRRSHQLNAICNCVAKALFWVINHSRKGRGGVIPQKGKVSRKGHLVKRGLTMYSRGTRGDEKFRSIEIE